MLASTRSYSVEAPRTGRLVRRCLIVAIALVPLHVVSSKAQPLTLDTLVEPSTVFQQDGETVPFALHFFIEFESLQALFAYIDEQAGRWTFDSEETRLEFADDLLRRGVESRVISMSYDLPREILVTHTAKQLAAALGAVAEAAPGIVYRGQNWSLEKSRFTEIFLALQERWKSGLNCWSAAPSIAARVLSNWYIIAEGISLFGSDYDSTEHFWQAVKYHPEVRTADLAEILGHLKAVDWTPWVDTLSNDQAVYFEHGYSVEFLRHNLTPGKLDWFSQEVARYAERFDLPLRELQQRDPDGLRFSSFEEKVLWGDLADVFHLLFVFAQIDDGRLRTAEMEPVLEAIGRHRFDAIYLAGYEGGKAGFISPEFQQLMLEIWKVKYLELERFAEVIRSTDGWRLLHSLNDASSADIPVPVYVEMLEEIRQMALGDHR